MEVRILRFIGEALVLTSVGNCGKTSDRSRSVAEWQRTIQFLQLHRGPVLAVRQAGKVFSLPRGLVRT